METTKTEPQKRVLRDYFLLKHLNIVVRFLIIADALIIGSTGLFAPIFAIFITNFIIGGGPAVVGIAAAIYTLTKSLLQMPVAGIIDRIKGEKDDFYFLVIFSLLGSLFPLFYLVIHTPLQLYVVQFFYGILMAFTYPSFMALFTRHIDHGKEGTAWGTYFTLTELTYSGFAAIGGFVALTLGFPVLIITVVVFSVLGALLLLPLKSFLKL